MRNLFLRTDALVAALGVEAFGAGMAGVPPLDAVVVAFVDVHALRVLHAVVEGAPVAGLAAAVVPARHVEARR